MLLAAGALGNAVSSVILMTPAVLYVSPRQNVTESEAQSSSRGYLRRLFDPAAYRSLLTGQSDYRAIWSVVNWVLRRPVDLSCRVIALLDRTPRPSHPRFNKHFWEGLRAAMSHGTPVLSLLAGMDSVTRDFNAEFQERVVDRHRTLSRLCTMRVLPRADHSLLSQEARQQALQAMLDWFQSLEEEEPARRAAG